MEKEAHCGSLRVTRAQEGERLKYANRIMMRRAQCARRIPVSGFETGFSAGATP